MKRSSHVALLVGGLSVAGVSAYAMMPVRQECKPVNPAAAAATSNPGAPVVIQDGKPVAATPPADAQQQNCRRTRWFNHSSTSSTGRSSGGVYVPGWSSRGDNRRSSSGVGFAPSRQSNRSGTTSRSSSTTTSRSSSSSSSRSTTSRGGFGSSASRSSS